MKNSNQSLTPLMRQYFEIKHKYPNTILLFQVGDFYELFFEDAEIASKFLGIALTQRGTDLNGDPIPLCGVPVHVLDHYLTKLVKGGFKVAICEQLELPKPGKVVQRGVTQVLTPGTLTDLKLLDEKKASYLAVFFPTIDCWAILFVELLTGQLFITKGSDKSKKILEAEINRFMPDEIVIPDIKLGRSFELFFLQQGYFISFEKWDSLNEVETKNWFARQFNNISLDCFADSAISSCLILFHNYLKRNNELFLEQIKQIYFYKPEDFLMLDVSTQRNLELVKNLQDNSSNNTLFAVLDKAMSPMGSRLIKKWILRPLIKKDMIEQRLEAVNLLFEDIITRKKIQNFIKQIGDIERVVGRIALSRTHIYDYLCLMKTFELIPELKDVLKIFSEENLLGIIATKIADFSELQAILKTAINEDTSQDWLIKKGYNQELDRLRDLIQNGTQAVIALEEKEQKLTKINNLKIRYNTTHGYCIETTKVNMHLIPEHYIHIQSLSNKERYITQELKDLEYDINRARNEAGEIEKVLFQNIKEQVLAYLNSLKKLAYSLSYLDALTSFSEVAYTCKFVRPSFNESRNIIIKDGRHAVVQEQIHNKFIPNDTNLTNDETLWIITGPNMSGKSTYLRQVALIQIMAQIGSYVPASSANLPIVDRIFTRIGASDNVAQGKSTFLVEMEETALICNQATVDSLVILDEVGRGTSTYDGMAIAQSVIEYIYHNIKARCLFATHYHELTELSKKLRGVACYYASSTKTTDGIILLHKILPGVAQGSFGLEVAKIAQLPEALILRAQEILQELSYMPAHKIKNDMHENRYIKELEQRIKELETYIIQQENQLKQKNEIISKIAHLDYEHMSAKQAYDILWKLKELL